ncbi:SCP-like extracellular [Paenibacillus albiflavus]|uniref:SCP-like extracellular n=1 Tax=Paenibacillus albiflavus TaxID=2545760 RepID=A0A4R4EMH6_9BACL|nr:CAP domain-containing protein [Paenibacillus albiflavus]TCZ81037.1 SCP-like extracellular [Paenibacillus albiflavus]
MKKKQLRSLITGSIATAVLAGGLVLPLGSKAEAASASNIDCNQQFQQIQKLLVQWNFDGSFDNLKDYLSKLPTIGTEPKEPQKEKPTTPSEKPSTGSGSSNNNGTPTTPSQDNNNAVGQTDAASFAAQVVDLVNKERSKAGLKPLTTQADLTNMAAAKAADMRKNNYFDHQSPTYGSPFDMMKQFGISYRSAGENIAKGQRTPAEVMNAWMNSEGHRKNILDPSFTAIGVAYDNGYWVQEFIGN